ncbi:MAG: PAS domain-containing protein, partial [Spirochaetaceae bacterium]|nr:PAS domain-containing protein [Spirochaetaceae bacterium]
MMTLGVMTLFLHFIIRGLRLNNDLVISNFDDYIICTILLLLCGFILALVIKQKKENEEKYTSVVNNSKDGILIHDSKTIKFVNTSILKILGFSRNEISGKSILDFVVPDDQKRFSDLL